MSEWYPTQIERVVDGLLLRVSATASPHRWKWFVVPVNNFVRAPNWYRADGGKGAKYADARGYSANCEKAQRDAEAMAAAMVDHKAKR